MPSAILRRPVARDRPKRLLERQSPDFVIGHSSGSCSALGYVSSPWFALTSTTSISRATPQRSAISPKGTTPRTPPPCLPTDSEPSGIKIQWFEGTPHWITKQSVIGGNTVDGDFSHLVTINRIYQLWNATIPIPGSDDMGQWNGTFDFWGNLGSSSATLRGVNSDGSLTGFANVSFESLGFTQEKALEIARIKERALHHEWDLLAERIKQINALISAGFFVGGLVALAIGASVLTGGVLVLIGAIIGVIGLVAEWFLSTRKTPLELAIIANFPSAASAGGG